MKQGTKGKKRTKNKRKFNEFLKFKILMIWEQNF